MDLCCEGAKKASERGSGFLIRSKHCNNSKFKMEGQAHSFMLCSKLNLN